MIDTSPIVGSVFCSIRAVNWISSPKYRAMDDCSETKVKRLLAIVYIIVGGTGDGGEEED